VRGRPGPASSLETILEYPEDRCLRSRIPIPGNPGVPVSTAGSPSWCCPRMIPKRPSRSGQGLGSEEVPELLTASFNWTIFPWTTSFVSRPGETAPDGPAPGPLWDFRRRGSPGRAAASRICRPTTPAAAEGGFRSSISQGEPPWPGSRTPPRSCPRTPRRCSRLRGISPMLGAAAR